MKLHSFRWFSMRFPSIPRSSRRLARPPGVSGFTQGEEHGFNVVFARRAKMNETRTQSKNINHLPLKKFLDAYLSKLLAGGQFEVEQISNPKIPSKIKIFIEFSMKISKNRKIQQKKRKLDFFIENFHENLDFRFSDF